MISRALFLFLLFSAISTHINGQTLYYLNGDSVSLKDFTRTKEQIYYYKPVDTVLLEMLMLVHVRSDRVRWSYDHESSLLIRGESDYPTRLLDWSLKRDFERVEILRVADLPREFVFIECRQYSGISPRFLKGPDSLRQVRQHPMLYDYWGDDTAKQRKGYCLFIACVHLRDRKLYRLRGFKELDTESFLKEFGYEELKKLELPFLDVDCMYRKRKLKRKYLGDCRTDTSCTASCNCDFGELNIPGLDSLLSNQRKHERKILKRRYGRHYH